MTSILVIDTNVLEYLFDDKTHNSDGHIDTLLRDFAENQQKLGIDRPTTGQPSRIMREYRSRLQHHIKEMDEQTLRRLWLRYVLEVAEQIDVEVDLSDGLGKCIASKIGHKTRVHAETSDQIFVYVAIALNCVIVSDNKYHITNHAKQLRKCAKAQGSGNADFLSSAAASIN